jgi:chromate transporter
VSVEPVKGTPGEVFAVFLKLGLTSFGGPIAHLGYYREELVARRKWLDETDYADLVALCQFLPGPASSQVGFSLGIFRGNGLLGGLAAWFAFTMPSALILFAFAMSAAAFTGPVAEGLLHGLKLVAVAVVAQAIWAMARTLTPDRTRAGIALAAIAIVVFFAGSFGADRSDRARGLRWPLAMSRRRRAGFRASEFSGQPASRHHGARPVRGPSPGPSDPCLCNRLSDACPA